jgi:hypothetical protein
MTGGEMRVEPLTTAIRPVVRPEPVARTGAEPRPVPEDPDVRVQIAVPAVPPPDVMDEVRAAYERADIMAMDDRELHFQKDPASSRIIIEVRDLAGTVIRTIPPSTALGIMTGEKGWR